MQNFLIILLSSILAFCAVQWVYFKILKIAIDNNIVDNPDFRKLQRRPIPVLGGLAVWFGLVTGVLAGACATYLLADVPLGTLTPVLCVTLIMIFTGAIDDILDLSPTVRFVMEILVMLALIFASGVCGDNLHGLWGVQEYSWWIAVPVTVFAGVGIINALNMIDGVNGLCSGLCIMSSLFFGSIFIKMQDIPNAVLAFSLAVSTFPFMLHNIFGRKSKMFLGDAGTMMIGIIMVWFSMCLLGKETPVSLPAEVDRIALALAILSVPVFDTIRVMLVRIIHGRSPFHPDKSHLHHIFIKAGVSHSVTTLLEISINLLIVLILTVCINAGMGLDAQLYVVIASSVILVWGLFVFIHIQEKRHTRFMHKLTKFGVKSHIGHTEAWLRLESMLDASVKDDPFAEFEESMQGRRLVYDYMKGKAEVYVSDILKRSGADPGSVGSILEEGIADGSIKVVTALEDGSPDIVMLSSE